MLYDMQRKLESCSEKMSLMQGYNMPKPKSLHRNLYKIFTLKLILY